MVCGFVLSFPQTELGAAQTSAVVEARLSPSVEVVFSRSASLGASAAANYGDLTPEEANVAAVYEVTGNSFCCFSTRWCGVSVSWRVFQEFAGAP